ncbi:MAG: tetratricopeptide repeat protein [Acidobacteria bacterium]|nr:MAG: tetratricopeptide repeat protein [Acidobacteriota bacterium]
MLSCLILGLVLLQPGTTPARLKEASDALAANDIRKAELILEKTIKADPKSAEAYHLLGAIRLTERRFPEAESHLQKALELNPKLIAGYIALADLRIDQNRRDDAAAILKKALQIDPKDPRLLMRLGTAEAEAGRIAESLKYLEAVPEAEATPGYWEILGRTYVSTGRFDQAEQAYLRLLKQEPGSIATLRVLSGIALKRGDSPKAWEYIAQARTAAPNLPEVLYDFAQVSLVNNLVAEAIRAFRLLLIMDPDNPNYLFGLGNALLENVNFAEAEIYFAKFVKLRPEDPTGHLMLGYSLFVKKQYPEAQSQLETALQLDPNLTEAYYHLGAIAAALNEDEKAVSLFQETLRKNPNHGLAHFGIGKVHFGQKKYPEAMAAMQKAAESIPSDPELHFHMSRVYAFLNQKDKAKAEVELYSKLTAEKEKREVESRRMVYGATAAQ